MKKKIVNALLMMAVVAPSVGSLVSCKDYNEDLNTELRSELAKEASLREALQTQVNSLKATVDAINSCKCDLTQYYTKVEADNKFLTQSSIQSYLDQVSANKAAIDQLQAAIDLINGKLGSLGDKTIVEQLNEMNTTIISVKAIADEALELAKNGGKCTCNFTEINQKIDNLEKLVAGWDGKLADVNKKAADAMAKAETNEAWINANKETIEALKPLVGQDVLGRLQTIENNYMKKDDITKLVDEAKAAAEDAKNVAAGAFEQAEKAITDAQVAKTEAALNSARIGTLEETVKTLVSKEEFQVELQKVNDRVDQLTTAVKELDAQLVKIKGDMTKMITGLITQTTENPVLGYINSPFGINQYLLAAYYGQADNGIEFPARDGKYYLNASDVETWTPRNLQVMGIASLKDVEGYVTKGDERFVADFDGDITGNAGTVYLTVNPSSVNFTGQVLDLETSAQNASPITLAPLEPSEAELNFGIFRDTRGIENGFYSAKATLSADDIDKARLVVDYDGMKDAVKNALKNRTKQNIANAALEVLQSVSNEVPAYGMKASWTDSDDQIHSVFSQYNLATIAVKPLSFSFMKDKTFHHVPGFGKIRSFVSKFINNVKVKLPDFKKYKIRFQSIIVGEDITTDAEGRILVPVKAIVEADGKTVEVAMDGVYADDAETLTQLVDEINQRWGAGSDVDKKLADLFNEIEETNNFQTYIDDAKDNLYKNIAGYINKVENIILKFVNNAHRSLYITLIGQQDGKMAMLSDNLVNPSKANAGELTLVPTTWSLQYFAPIYKKFVAVTNVYDANTKAELDLGEAQSLAAAANGGENMLKVVDGLKNCTFEGESGKIYEITYTAVDFLGVVMIKKFYVEF
jgi:hypothetical protein